jgi:DNA-binding NarL/FixJ family response regulator
MTANPATEVLRVVVVEDDRLVRDGLRALLDGSPGFCCLAVARSVEEALAARLNVAPEAVLLDIHLPGMRGSLGAEPLAAKWPQTAILMHTISEDDDLVFEALCHGAAGYIVKRTPAARLLAALEEVCRGGAPMSPEIARKVLARLRRLGPAREPDEQLSPRELEVLAALAKGLSYGETATQLAVTINTVRTYIRAIYEKLHVHTKSEAVAKALRSGLI